jgi:hypothetical protein
MWARLMGLADTPDLGVGLLSPTNLGAGLLSLAKSGASFRCPTTARWTYMAGASPPWMIKD